MGRNKKSSSSSSSSSSDNESSKKKKKDKQHKQHKQHGGDKHRDQVPGQSHASAAYLPSHDRSQQPPSGYSYPMSVQQPQIPSVGFPTPPVQQGFRSGPAQPVAPVAHGPPSGTPAAGHRIALSTDTPFPTTMLPRTTFYDLGGQHQPVYVGSAILPMSVQPCKIAPHLDPTSRVLVPLGGLEQPHMGRFDLLPIDDQTMEWVTTSHGLIPHGRIPVEGGYEENGQRLFHATAYVSGVLVPGKTGEHLGAAHVPFNGEQRIPENYQILCWRQLGTVY